MRVHHHRFGGGALVTQLHDDVNGPRLHAVDADQDSGLEWDRDLPEAAAPPAGGEPLWEQLRSA